MDARSAIVSVIMRFTPAKSSGSGARPTRGRTDDPRKALRRELGQGVALLLALSAVAGCHVSRADIAYWARTQKGPSKIVAVLLEETYPTELRVDAALALIEMERNDVDGIQELSRAIDRISADDPEHLGAIVEGLVPELVGFLTPDGRTAQTGHRGAAPAALEVRAKDAAYIVAAHASSRSKARLGHAMLSWFSADFPRRAVVGVVSAEQVAEAFGEPGVLMLVRAMTERVPKELPRMAERVAELGSAEAKAAAAERLVAVERAMESPDFLGWLEGQIRRAAARDGRGRTAAHVKLTAASSRERFIDEGALSAMRFLADEPVIAERLLQIAESRAPGALEGELLEAFEARRVRALSALDGKVRPEHAPRLLPLALGADLPLALRRVAFDRLIEARDIGAIAPMWPLVQAAATTDASREERERVRLVRMKAVEVVLALGEGESVPRLLRRLPRGNAASYEPEELALYARRLAEMGEPPEADLRAELESPIWWRRALAIIFLEEAGRSSDVPLLEALTGDGAPTVGEGWSHGEPARKTVGQVAAASVARLRERLAKSRGTLAEHGGSGS